MMDESVFLEVRTTNGFTVKFSPEDLAIAASYVWYAAKQRNGSIYAVTHAPASVSKSGSRMYMHRMILFAMKGQLVDHRNGDGLDNRRPNLRFCTHAQNMANNGGCRNRKTSPYKGVHFSADRQKWVASIGAGGRIYRLGRYGSAEDAARAYDAAAVKWFGEFARLNFPL
jgi:hypothetical protein